jgi:hypothetical protein
VISYTLYPKAALSRQFRDLTGPFKLKAVQKSAFVPVHGPNTCLEKRREHEIS